LTRQPSCKPSTTIGLITGSLLEQRRHDDAVAFAAIIAQLKPDDAVASFRLGYALQMVKRHRDALAPYRHALALDPQLPQLRTNLAGRGDARPGGACRSALIGRRPGNLSRKALRAQAATARLQPVCGQRRHRLAPAVERLPMHRAVKHTATARAARALRRHLFSGRIHNDPESVTGHPVRK
jgi:hypothetical protein